MARYKDEFKRKVVAYANETNVKRAATKFSVDANYVETWVSKENIAGRPLEAKAFIVVPLTRAIASQTIERAFAV